MTAAIAMSVWSKFAKMDSALQRGLDNSFAFVFGGKLVPAEVEEALKQCAEDEVVSTYEGYIEVPNEFTVMVSEKDYAQLEQNYPDLPWDFADQLTRYFRNQRWTPPGVVVVKLVLDSSLRTGQLKPNCLFVPDPEEDSGFYNSRGSADEQPDSDSDGEAYDDSDDSFDPNDSYAYDTTGHSSPDTDDARKADEMNHHDGAHAQPANPSGLPKASVLPADASPETTRFAASQQPAASAVQPTTDTSAEIREPKVSLLLQDGSSRTFLVQHGSNIIGRSNDADFRLPDTGVSRQHAEITWDGHDAVITDLQSTNGTTVNEIPVDNWLLADGDVITVGHSYIEVRITGSQA